MQDVSTYGKGDAMNGKGMGTKRISGAFKASGAVLAVAGVIRLIVTLMRDTIIVYSGIRAYSALSMLSTAVLIVAGSIFAVVLIIYVSVNAKERKEAMIREAQSNTGPDLRMKGELDPVRVRENLKEKAKDWPEDPYVDSAINAIFKNMDDMDDYQKKLKELLDSNGADALRDTEEVLDKVEQHICRNVRKLINIMIVLDSKSSNDRELMLTTAKNCSEDNRKLLDSTRNFMMAVSQFLNTQGEESGTIQEVESYKKILTDQIQEGGIYR